MSLPDTMVVTADEMQQYADECRERAERYEDLNQPMFDLREAKMLYAAAGALQGLANKLRKEDEQEGR